MKNLIVLSLLIVSVQLRTQRPDFSAKCKEEMKKLSYMVGDWKGESVINSPTGKLKLVQTEHIEWKLDGLVLSVEGTGKDQDRISFEAFALLNFNPIDQQFKFKSFVKEGFSTDSYFKVLEENKFEWGFDIPSGGKSKYVITLDPTKKTWNEIGEFSRDGATWMTFIEMKLTKI